MSIQNNSLRAAWHYGRADNEGAENAGKEGEEMNADKRNEELDETISNLCKRIQEKLQEKDRNVQEEVTEMTKALAELVAARAMLQ